MPLPSIMSGAAARNRCLFSEEFGMRECTNFEYILSINMGWHISVLCNHKIYILDFKIIIICRSDLILHSITTVIRSTYLFLVCYLLLIFSFISTFMSWKFKVYK